MHCTYEMHKYGVFSLLLTLRLKCNLAKIECIVLEALNTRHYNYGKQANGTVIKLNK